MDSCFERHFISRLVPSFARISRWLTSSLFAAALSASAANEATPAVASPSPSAESEALTLKPGDAIKIGFPGVPSMDTTQQIRHDGLIVLPIIGEYAVAGKSTEALNKELLDLYAPKLVSKEVTVTLLSSPFVVYVTGAVLRPGKLTVERRITVYDAIVEVGGFDKMRANLKKVTVVRQEKGKTQKFVINVKKMMEGDGVDVFWLKDFDSVYVPEKFSMF